MRRGGWPDWAGRARGRGAGRPGRRGRRRRRTGRPSSSWPGSSWSGWWPTRTGSSPPAVTRWPARTQRRGALCRDGDARRRGHDRSSTSTRRSPSSPRCCSTRHAAGARDEAPLLYACLLLSNAGSLLLPGSNLTNLIVLGHLHLSGGAFLRIWRCPRLSAALVTALVVGVGITAPCARIAPIGRARAPVVGVGLARRRRGHRAGRRVACSGLPVAAVGAGRRAAPRQVAGLAHRRQRPRPGRRRRAGPWRSWASRSWPACSGWPSRWGRWAARGRARDAAGAPERLGHRGRGRR